MSTVNSATRSTHAPAGGGDLQRAGKPPEILRSLDFTERSPARKTNLAPIGCLPPSVQESIMVKELLAVLQGFSRDYITVLPLENPLARQAFSVDESLDSALQRHVGEILPIASLYSRVTRFIDWGGQPESGMVVHAFAHAARQFIRQYQVMLKMAKYRNFLIDREDAYRDGQLTMQRLSHHMMPLVAAFDCLAAVIDTQTSTGAHGGTILSIFHDRLLLCPTSKEAEQLLLATAKTASLPFFSMLSQWMYEGTFDDPYSEFMIAVSKQKRMKDTAKRIHDYTYWENRYTLVPDMVPKFLESFADKILRSGKYVNIIKQCGQSIHERETPGLLFSLDSRYYEVEVEKAYLYASGRLLHLMIESENLIQKLRTFKHFFLLDADDFLPEFLLFAAEDLRLPISRVDKTKLFAVFEEAIKLSVLHVDPYKSMIKPVLRGKDLLKTVHKMSDQSDSCPSSSSSDQSRDAVSLNAFTMDCDIKFPLCLVVNDEAKIKYQILFQNLFRLKVAEWNLTRLWTSCVSNVNSALTVCCSSFVHQMLEFIKSLQHYFSAEVIEPYWQQMMLKIRAARTFDEVFEEHNEFIASCSKDCLLTSPDILRVLFKLLDTCGANCVALQDSHFLTNTADMADTLDGMREKFGVRVCSLLVVLADSRQNREFEYKLVGAIHRLDFNEYYKTRIRERAQSRSSDTTQASEFRVPATASAAVSVSLPRR